MKAVTGAYPGAQVCALRQDLYGVHICPVRLWPRPYQRPRESQHHQNLRAGIDPTPRAGHRRGAIPEAAGASAVLKRHVSKNRIAPLELLANPLELLANPLELLSNSSTLPQGWRNSVCHSLSNIHMWLLQREKRSCIVQVPGE